MTQLTDAQQRTEAQRLKGPHVFLKNVFFASASVLMLALAYHLGASTATAQAPANPVVVAPNGSEVVTSAGDVYWGGPNGTGPWNLVSNVFNGASPISPIVAAPNGSEVILANGDVYWGGPNGTGPWQLVSNVFGSATASATQSWGALKVKAR